MKSLSRTFFFIICLSAFFAVAPLGAEEAATTPDPAASSSPPPSSSESMPAPAEPAPVEPVPLPPPGKSSPPDISMEAFGVANPDCLEWTDTCQVCARDAQNAIACSRPGIACLPGDISCRSLRK
jgi:hypothetical protein